MPELACLHSTDCPQCQARLVPKPGDCCVFCSYGDQVCPPRRLEQSTFHTLGRYRAWRRLHILASSTLVVLALVHVGLTPILVPGWTPDAVWFLGTGLGLLLLGALNLSHVGVEPCRMPTTRLIRAANWLFVAFGLAAVWAIPQPQAWGVLGCLLGQALAARHTLPGPV